MLFGLKLVKPSTITETHSRSRNITRTRLRTSSELSPQQTACQVLTVRGYSRQARCRFSTAFNSQEATSRLFRTSRSNSRRVRRLNKPDHTQMWCQDHECMEFNSYASPRLLKKQVFEFQYFHKTG
jgi:hypothetical protein